ncbi:hypothetical protein BJY04DRAFT_192418 [Aspergillus karnatakaensis]|uniref:uncharacterized protein n=1 Tax=Aspergillus karnatakaensis TaxID=1810916 RepID=UPI003CCE41CE
MDDGPPPPPPPHGEKPQTTHGEYRKSSDLPQGNYDIFIIPPHSAGSGFLYLPSLQCQRNSFLAGSACTLVAVYLYMTLAPVVRLWYATTVASGGGTGIAILAVGVVGIGGWAFGNYQAGLGGSSRQGRPGPGFGPNWFGSGTSGASGANGPSGSGGSGDNYSRGGSFGGQGGGPHQQGNYGANFAGGPPPGNQYSGNHYRANNEPPPQSNPGSNSNTNPDPGPPPEPKPSPKAGGGPDAKPSGSNPQDDKKPHTAEDWEKAREETRRKEELRRKMEEFKRKREAEAREKERQREREKMENELRERREQLEREMAAAREAAAREARLQAEKEAAEHRARLEREAAEARLKAEKAAAEARRRDFEARARAERQAAEARAKAEKEAAEAKARAEQLEAEAKARAEKEAAEKEAAAKAAAKKEADAKFAALKEAAAKKYAEKKARDAQEAAAAKEAAATASKVSSATAPPRTPSPKKPSVPPSKASAPAADDDAYSFRPYDRPRRPYGGTSQSSVYSESSYAPSQSTARTTPPPSNRPSNRGPYETKDPDKIVIRGVYAFNQAFLRTPVAQLVSGQGMVTEGLVLRITTEGLFIDDDIRGVPQREWDVKAWTMKLVEVWCPKVGPPKPNAQKANQAFFRRSTNDAPTAEESDAYISNFLKVCKNTCRLASPSFSSQKSADSKESQPYGGLHVLRATIRDQEGRRYLFVLQETEGWKVALGLQRLQRGSLSKSLGVCGMAIAETRTVLSGLGY